jgi:hypothetical protein
MFSPETTFGAEIRVIRKLFTTIGTENHEHRLRQTFEKNNLSIATPGSVNVAQRGKERLILNSARITVCYI